MIKIEKDVPMPGCYRDGESDLDRGIRELSIGDSFVIPKRQQSTATWLAGAAGIRVTTRTLSDTEIRVWRIA